MSAIYSVFTSPNHPPVPNHLPTLIVTPVNNPQHVLYSYIHTSFNKETYLLTPSPQGDLCVAKMVPPPGSRGPGGAGSSDSGHSSDSSRDKTTRCEASRNLKWSITNAGIAAPVYKLTLPNPDSPGNEQPLFQISKPNPNATWWSMFYFTYAGHLIPPKRIEFGKIQKNSATQAGGGGTRVSITGKTAEEKAVWQTLGEGNEDMVEWIVLCAALNLLDDEIIKAAEKASGGSTGPNKRSVPSSRPQGNGVPGMQIRQTKGNAPAPFRQGQMAVQRAQQHQQQHQQPPQSRARPGPPNLAIPPQQAQRPLQSNGPPPMRQPSPYQRSPVSPHGGNMAARPPPMMNGGGPGAQQGGRMPMPQQYRPMPQQAGGQQPIYNSMPVPQNAGQMRGASPGMGRRF